MLNGFLRQSTASQTRVVGPFVDDTDFKTLETSLTIANTDVKLSKNGAAAVNKNAGGASHVINGDYALTFDATDTDTVGELRVSIAVAGALIVPAKFAVIEEAAFDHLFASGAAPAAPTTTAVADAVWDEPRGSHTVVGSFGEAYAPILGFAVATATTAASTTSFATASITEATADHFIGRIVVWISGVLAGQATDITDYALTSGEGVFTVTAMTDAPAAGDRGLIL